jgi:hypothetical protein
MGGGPAHHLAAAAPVGGGVLLVVLHVLGGVVWRTRDGHLALRVLVSPPAVAVGPVVLVELVEGWRNRLPRSRRAI